MLLAGLRTNFKNRKRLSDKKLSYRRLSESRKKGLPRGFLYEASIKYNFNFLHKQGITTIFETVAILNESTD